ncbi:MAG: SOS response-associated peptidase family protein [Brevibacillus sp.]|nr:SOS response-associated peptidase family protein [Brevibacillus sp.]
MTSFFERVAATSLALKKHVRLSDNTEIICGKRLIRIVLKCGELIRITGLYDTWTAPDGRKVSTFTIITTTPNEVVKDIHDRMPVILRKEDEDLLLDSERFDPDLLRSLLVPYDTAEMRSYPVPALVENLKNDVPECIEEIPWQ